MNFPCGRLDLSKIMNYFKYSKQETLGGFYSAYQLHSAGIFDNSVYIWTGENFGAVNSLTCGWE